MKTAQYVNTQTATGGRGKYPLSTQTLDFIQQQIQLLQQLALIGGKNYILLAPVARQTGIVVIGGEVLTLAAQPAFSSRTKYVNVATIKSDITADDETYREARTERVASFSEMKGNEAYDINSFANVSNGMISTFPTNQWLATQVRNMPNTVLTYLEDVLAEKLTNKEVSGMTKAQMDGLRTPCLLSCTRSVAVMDGITEYSLLVAREGGQRVRQELTQQGKTYVRVWGGSAWGAWECVNETAMHLDVKIVGTTVYLRHGVLPSDVDVVLLRKKHRSRYRATGGANAYAKNKGIRKKRQSKTQYVHFKGIVLSKGTAGKWYVPKCIKVADSNKDGNLIGKEMPSLCESLFYHAHNGAFRIQGYNKNVVMKGDSSAATQKIKRTQHNAYARIGVQIARLGNKEVGSKDSGGEIVKMKYRVQQMLLRKTSAAKVYGFKRCFSME